VEWKEQNKLVKRCRWLVLRKEEYEGKKEEKGQMMKAEMWAPEKGQTM